MAKRKPLHLLGAALLALASSAMAAPPTLQVSPPKLEVQEHALDNGLKVLLHEDHSVPVVSTQIWYHVGSKNERPGRTGFAHLFEHLMFKGSANLGPEEHIQFVESVGGRINATTDFDRTLYFETVPSNYLERILWMEADRMRSLDLSEANFVSERDVVKEERRLRIDNPPFGRLFEVVLGKTYEKHPYRILPIGTLTDLEAATIEDVRAFHRTYYVPNNATLVIAGDFEPEPTMKWVRKYFGDIPRGGEIPREIPKEPAQTGERRTADYDPKTPLPAVIMSYHVPEAGHPDVYALEVASNILSSGESSRLYRDLIYERQMALDAGGQILVLEDPGLFFFYSILQAGSDPAEVEKVLQGHVERLRNEPVSADELAKAKNQIVSSLVFGRQRVQDKGEALGYSSLILGDPAQANQQLARFQKVTAADVQRVAKKYFSAENRTVVQMLPEAMRPAEPPPAGEGPAGEGQAEPRQETSEVNR
jgi:zinc protease